jgi:hypothetical protein
MTRALRQSKNWPRKAIRNLVESAAPARLDFALLEEGKLL